MTLLLKLATLFRDINQLLLEALQLLSVHLVRICVILLHVALLRLAICQSLAQLRDELVSLLHLRLK